MTTFESKGKIMNRRRLLGGIFSLWCGWMIASVIGTPQQVLADTRISLASLQTAINKIISGETPVGDADHAGYADFAMESISSRYSQRASSVPTDIYWDATAETAGFLRFNRNTQSLEVSDGTQWRALAYAQ